MNEKQASVAARIAELACLPMSELWTVWDRYFPRRPDYPNRTHVESRLAYKLQEEAFGGLAPVGCPRSSGHIRWQHVFRRKRWEREGSSRTSSSVKR